MAERLELNLFWMIGNDSILFYTPLSFGKSQSLIQSRGA